MHERQQFYNQVFTCAHVHDEDFRQKSQGLKKKSLLVAVHLHTQNNDIQSQTYSETEKSNLNKLTSTA